MNPLRRDLDLAHALTGASESGAEAFRACSIAREIGGWAPATTDLLDRERYSGRLLDAYEAVRALRSERIPS